jgi:hypothetical protein
MQGSLQHVGHFMEVNLKSKNGKFSINDVTPSEQEIPDKGYSEWIWDVTPQIHGQHTLQSAFWFVYKTPSVTPERAFIDIADKDIHIRVTLNSIEMYVKDNGIKFLTGIVGLIVGNFALIGRRKRLCAAIMIVGAILAISILFIDLLWLLK